MYNAIRAIDRKREAIERPQISSKYCLFMVLSKEK